MVGLLSLRQLIALATYPPMWGKTKWEAEECVRRMEFRRGQGDEPFSLEHRSGARPPQQWDKLYAAAFDSTLDDLAKVGPTAWLAPYEAMESAIQVACESWGSSRQDRSFFRLLRDGWDYAWERGVYDTGYEFEPDPPE